MFPTPDNVHPRCALRLPHPPESLRRPGNASPNLTRCFPKRGIAFPNAGQAISGRRLPSREAPTQSRTQGTFTGTRDDHLHFRQGFPKTRASIPRLGDDSPSCRRSFPQLRERDPQLRGDVLVGGRGAPSLQARVLNSQPRLPGSRRSLPQSALELRRLIRPLP
jgi:hypothetical protein